jgi:hypothetical protein
MAYDALIDVESAEHRAVESGEAPTGVIITGIDPEIGGGLRFDRAAGSSW